MKKSAEEASALLKALANPHRLMIVCKLIEGERPVGELASELGLRDSTVSQHLSLLRRDRILKRRRDGQVIYYSIANAVAHDIVDLLYQCYCQEPKGRRK
ncbi:MAG: metalloregulator ArsR/SmtB family transcription factor [Alphaproteobacteria bacterium]|nr:metalloregulator ArsR/SmtB family transcription factor [Alphaproteobacteria bacterium]